MYISEPVFAGDYNEILRLFHDEEQVREAAFAATCREVDAGRLALVPQTFFLAPVRYRDFAEFERKVVNATHAAHRLSLEVAAPLRVDLLQKI